LTTGHHFYIRRNMEKAQAVAALAALAQDSRLDVFRLLIEAGPDGLSAGTVAERLKLAPNTLTFHFDRLRHAGLVTCRRAGRSIIYAARFDSMRALLAYLTENCCQGTESCAPAARAAKPARRRKEPV
jgi:ArsR family transcriptional regulator, arsenate/arsenite/antimonite-responsive transcriptional repressor